MPLPSVPERTGAEQPHKLGASANSTEGAVFVCWTDAFRLPRLFVSRFRTPALRAIARSNFFAPIAARIALRTVA